MVADGRALVVPREKPYPPENSRVAKAGDLSAKRSSKESRITRICERNGQAAVIARLRKLEESRDQRKRKDGDEHRDAKYGCHGSAPSCPNAESDVS